MTETASADVPTVRLVDHDGAVVGDVGSDWRTTTSASSSG